MMHFSFDFARPACLWLFLLFIPLIAWHVTRWRTSQPSLRMSSTQAFNAMPRSWREILRYISLALKYAALACIIILLCKPQAAEEWDSSKTEGTDIIVALDVSGSMLARDLKPDRLEAAKQVAVNFVNGREHDNVGLVLFAGEAFLQVPMSTNRAITVDAINNVDIQAQTGGQMLEDGTAIGDGIITALNHINKEDKARSRSIILLTDGSNNTGIVAPITAAKVAADDSVKIYTIGVGSRGTAPYPMVDDFGNIVSYKNLPVTIDEETLKQIASSTSGKYFRATDTQTLQDIFNEIDQLEKAELDVTHFTATHDQYAAWAWLLLAIVMLDILLEYTLLRRTP